MEDREMNRSLIYELACRVDDETGVPTAAEVAASLRVVNRYIDTAANSTHGATVEPVKSGSVSATRPVHPSYRNWIGSSGQTLRSAVRTLFDGFAGRTVAALFGLKDTTLTAAEVERLRRLVEQGDTKDK